MKIELDWPDSVPLDHIEVSFLQGMLNRMAFGFHNYGHSRRTHHTFSGLENAKLRLAKYEESKNSEFLMDAANYCMIEFFRPSMADTFFRPTTKDESPGDIVDGRMVRGKEDYECVRVVREGD